MQVQKQYIVVLGAGRGTAVVDNAASACPYSLNATPHLLVGAP